MERTAARTDAVYFIDPPYTAGGKSAGSRLYNHFELDHERLFAACARLVGQFLMTYDNAEEVKVLARKHGFQMKPVAMKNTHHAEMTELIIGRELSFLDETMAIHESPPPFQVTQASAQKKARSKPGESISR